MLSCRDLEASLAFFTGALGFRIERISPADAPERARLFGHGLRLALETGEDLGGRLRILGTGPGARELVAPNGTLIEIAPPPPPPPPFAFAPSFLLTKSDAGPSGTGRAGMTYRDLLPGRLGGALIASHITLKDGPVADWTHFHEVDVQLIVCRRGGALVVYEDQGPPFWLEPFDLVLQPPGIRHRVLESREGLEVIELGAPAAHETFADHGLDLPTVRLDPSRRWGGQPFLRHRSAAAPWTRAPGGLLVQETGLRGACGAADAAYLRGEGATQIHAGPGEAVFCAVFGGCAAALGPEGPFHAEGADVFVLPPGAACSLMSQDPAFALLRVALTLG